MTYLTRKNGAAVLISGESRFATSDKLFTTRKNLINAEYFIKECGYKLEDTEPSPYCLLKQAVKFDGFTGQSYATEKNFQGEIITVRGGRLLVEFSRKHCGKNKIQLWCNHINFIFTPRGVKLVGLSQLRKLKGYETTMI